MSLANNESVQNDSFSKSILWSAIGHVLLLLIFGLKIYFFPDEPLNLQNAIRVDLVALPEKNATLPTEKATERPPTKTAKETPSPKDIDDVPVIKKPLPAVKTESKPAEKIKPTEKNNLSAKQMKAMDRLKSLEAIERMKSLQKIEAMAKNSEKSQGGNSAPVKGNILAQGDSLVGIAQINYNDYIKKMRDQTRDNWEVPEWLASLQLKVQVLVFIDESGYVLEKRILRSSGNDVFDGKALEAVARSSPYSAPPERIQGVVKNRGVVFNFPE